MSLVGFCSTIIVAPFIGSLCLPPTLIERFYMILSNGLLFFAHIGKVWIAKVENASSATLLMRAFDVILTFLAQFFFFKVLMIFSKHTFIFCTFLIKFSFKKKSLEIYSTIGASIIFLAIMSSGFCKVLENLPKNSWLLQQQLILWLYGLKAVPIQDVSRRRTSSECIHL